jgi:sec-independent protein translocase protein TatC
MVIRSTVITPPDAISAIMVAIPLIVLYEIGVLLSSRIYRKQQNQDAAWEQEYGAK